MRRCRNALLVLALSGGVGAPLAAVLAGPADAAGLPVPVPTLGPVLPSPTSQPVPGPTLPGGPLPSAVPGVPVPAVPALPGLPRLPGTAGAPRPAAPPRAAAPPAGAAQPFGFLPFGHYVDDGLGSAGASPEPFSTATFTLPPDLPYDTTGFDQTIYPLTAGARGRVPHKESLASGAVHALTSHLLLDAVAVLAIGGAGAGVVVARRRGLLGG
jgi:hypothetical protein